ncbi:hypothetical protein JTB14_002290 [Gonioctena quinquepunctata]|nr:hypothetical protein JTB14_002290 [Gonioctena quinquepunctata]
MKYLSNVTCVKRRSTPRKYATENNHTCNYLTELNEAQGHAIKMHKLRWGPPCRLQALPGIPGPCSADRKEISYQQAHQSGTSGVKERQKPNPRTNIK